jgi:PIN domain nuclease of toxin-antitoxin system
VIAERRPVRGPYLLLDTCVALWWFAGDLDQLGPPGVAAITDAEEIHISAATVWEIEIKRALGKLEAPDDINDMIIASGFYALGISAEHALTAARLPPHHSDPFDRMLVAQAITEKMTLVTADKRIAAYPAQVLSLS